MKQLSIQIIQAMPWSTSAALMPNTNELLPNIFEISQNGKDSNFLQHIVPFYLAAIKECILCFPQDVYVTPSRALHALCYCEIINTFLTFLNDHS